MGGLGYHCQRAWRQKLLLMQRMWFFPFFPPILFLFSHHKKKISLNMHFRRIFPLLAPSNTGDTTHQLVPCHKSPESLRVLPPSALTSNSSQIIFGVFCPSLRAGLDSGDALRAPQAGPTQQPRAQRGVQPGVSSR